jgi:pyroglutamyl-peptidase
LESRPRILVTGFGPFPGAPENPTEQLVQTLAARQPAPICAGLLRAAVLPTDYRRSWSALRRLYGDFQPDIVLHFGLSRRARAVHVERVARKRCSPELPDAAGFSPSSGLARRFGPESLVSTLPVEAIAPCLQQAGIPVAISEDAGGYVCNATFYRSLLAAQTGALVGLIHLPPEGQGGFDAERLVRAAELVVRGAADVWRKG